MPQWVTVFIRGCGCAGCGAVWQGAGMCALKWCLLLLLLSGCDQQKSGNAAGDSKERVPVKSAFGVRAPDGDGARFTLVESVDPRAGRATFRLDTWTGEVSILQAMEFHSSGTCLVWQPVPEYDSDVFRANLEQERKAGK